MLSWIQPYMKGFVYLLAYPATWMVLDLVFLFLKYVSHLNALDGPDRVI